MQQRSVPFTFPNGRGETLAGLIDLPPHGGAPLFYGVFAPCFTCTKESHAAHKVCRRLAARGAAMLRFDLTGLGGSGGSFAATNFSTRVLDIIAAAGAVAAAHAPPRLLVGHSISGTAALAAAERLPSVQALATIGAPRDPVYIVDKLERLGRIALTGDHAELLIAGRKVVLKKSFVDDARSHAGHAITLGAGQKLFIFHAPHDDVVSFGNARAIFDKADGDRELVSLREDATHLLERGEDDADLIAEMLCGFLAGVRTAGN